MCKMLGKKVNDPEIVDMDDITWSWHLASWLEDKAEKTKFMKSFGTFVGGFYNPEMARKVQDADNNENNIELSEEDEKASMEYVKKSIKEKEELEKNTGKKKKRLKIKK